MFTSRHLIASLTATAALVAGAGVAAASGDDGVPSLDEVETQAVDDTDVDTPEDHMIGFSADVRINGHRVQDEWYFAFGIDDHWPFFGSLWLLTDAETDEWIPLCLGFYTTTATARSSSARASTVTRTTAAPCSASATRATSSSPRSSSKAKRS